MPWSRPFDDPIPLPGRRELVTLRDAGAYIAVLPKSKQESPEWQACEHRHDAGAQSARRAGVQSVAQRSALGKAEAGAGSITFLFAVPELTRSAGIQLNKRVSLPV